MTLLEVLLAIFLALGLLALVIFFRVRENRYLKKNTREALSSKLREEIELEKSEAIRKKEKFESILRQFSGDKKE